MRRRSLLALAALCLTAAPAGVKFQDVADAAGLRPVILSGGERKESVVEVNGSGVCWFDYDSDGYLDLYFVNGSTVEALRSGSPSPSHNYLFRNRGDGTFEDVTSRAGVSGKGWGFGCAAADFDNDGDADLFVTNFGPNLLYRNNGDGTFTDVAEKAGAGGGAGWHAGATFGDYDRDGLLDLFVAGYLDFDPEPARNPYPQGCDYRGVHVKACGPGGYRGAPDALYRNNGDGTFRDVTEKAGVADRGLYFGFGAVFDDFDGDGWPDLLVANDSNPNYFYRNRKDGTFEEMGIAAGIGLSGDGKEYSNMGLAVGDYDRDGRMDVFITTFANDNYALFHNEGEGFFTDVSYPSGIAEPTIPWLGWATFFLDYDNDGWPDLFIANGHVYPEVDGKLNESYRQPLQLLRNLGSAKFEDASEKAGLVNQPRVSARGGAFADYDNDGKLDVVVSIMDGRPLLLRNQGGNANGWLALRLKGQTSNRDGLGARVTVACGQAVQYDHARSGSGYLSGNDPRLHFGLGSCEGAVNLTVAWPSGTVDRWEGAPRNRILTLTEGSHAGASH